MDSSTLKQAMGSAAGVNYDALVGPFNEAMVAAGVTTRLRAAHWISQLGHESGGLKWLEEIWGPTPAQRKYEGRSDLGNTVAGDGYRFRGRSPVQITGRGHYANLSKWAHGKGYVPSATFFVDNPDQLSAPKYTFLGPVWYWTVARPGLNAMCDRDDLIGVTKAINGGTNGLADRRARLTSVKTLGDKILPTKGGGVATLYDLDLSASFNFGGPRSTSALQRVVIHTTENSFGTPARNVAEWQARTETGSYHYLVDTNGTRVRCNTDDWTTWSTGNNAGNLYGLNLSFVGYASSTRAQWLAQDKMLRAGATVVADWCKKYSIPVTKVTTGRGICGHGDLVPFGGTDHTDPGPNFPWDVFISYVKAAQSGTTKTTPTTPSGGGSMSTLSEKRNEYLLDQMVGFEKKPDGLPTYTGWNLAEVLARARAKKFVSLTMVEMLVVSIAGTEDDLKAARAAANGGK